jgi:hypothetical protein
MTSSVSKDLTDYEVGEDLPEDYADWQLCKDPKNRGRAGILSSLALFLFMTLI